MTDAVLYELNDRIATITLNRPETRNALSDDVVPALIAQLERAEADSQVSCIILTGAGTSFSSGGNLKEIRAMTRRKNLACTASATGIWTASSRFRALWRS